MGWLDNWAAADGSAVTRSPAERTVAAHVSASSISFLRADIVVENGSRDTGVEKRLHTYAKLLRREVQRRTLETLRVRGAGSSAGVVGASKGSKRTTRIVLALTADEKSHSQKEVPKTTADALRLFPDRSSYDVLPEHSEISCTPDVGALEVVPGRGRTNTTWEIRITASSCRGVLFGIGKFLRLAVMGYEQSYQRKLAFAYFPVSTWSSSSPSTSSKITVAAPKTRVRQHQIAYRPKTNAYDAFSPEQMKQQILDCVWFGCNSIEVIPPGLDDASFSPHFGVATDTEAGAAASEEEDGREDIAGGDSEINADGAAATSSPWLEMLRTVSQFCDELDIMVSIWYPAFFPSYDEKSGALDRAKQHWALIMRQLPRLDFLFIPGGDPGGHPPAVLVDHVGKEQIAFCRATEAVVVRPDGLVSTGPRDIRMELWVSTQFGLSKSVDLGMESGWNPSDREQEFFQVVSQTQVPLTGVVYGPWSSESFLNFRKKLPPKFKLRNYPDLCHCVGCEFPQQGWDVQIALAHGREPISVRPQFFWAMLNQGEAVTDVLGCYSEGVSDDVNKFVALIASWEGTSEQETANHVEDHVTGCAPRGTSTSSSRSLLRDHVVMTEKRGASPVLAAGLLEYCRFLCLLWHDDVAKVMTTLLLDMERKDWLATSGSPDNEGSSSSSSFTAFEAGVRPFLDQSVRSTYRENWRMAMLKLRIYYDELVRRRTGTSSCGSGGRSSRGRESLRPSGSTSTTSTAESVATSTSGSSAASGSRSWSSSSSSATSIVEESPMAAQVMPVSGGEEAAKSWRATKVADVETPAPEQGESGTAKQDHYDPPSGEEDCNDVSSSSLRYAGSILPTPGERQTNLNALYAEVVALCYLLYAQIGYQTSVALGGQHRQRGAFADLFYTTGSSKSCALTLSLPPGGSRGAKEKDSCSIDGDNMMNFNSPATRTTKEPSLVFATFETGSSLAGYLSVGERWDDFCVGELVASRWRITQPALGNSSPDDSQRSLAAGAGIRIQPVFVSPDYSEVLENHGGRQRRETTAKTSREKTRDAVVDQMYFSQVYETVASDHDQIAACGIRKLRRSCLRWAVTVWPSARTLFLLTLPKRQPGKQGSGKYSVAITYIGGECITLGGDWEELGRDLLPTRCVLRSKETDEVLHEVHGYLDPFRSTACVSFPLFNPMSATTEVDLEVADNELLLEFEVQDRRNVSFCKIPMPVAEIAVFEGVGEGAPLRMKGKM